MRLEVPVQFTNDVLTACYNVFTIHYFERWQRVPRYPELIR